MSNAIRLLTIAIASAIGLCACTPKPPLVVRPEHVETVRVEYVPIPKRLTRQHPIAKGPQRNIHEVAKARERELIQCNADNAETATIQGTAVEPSDR